MSGNSKNNNHSTSHELGRLGNSAGSKPRIDINDVVGARLDHLDMPHMLEVLRGAYERKGNKLVFRPHTFRVQTTSGTLMDVQASMFKSFQDAQEEFKLLLDKLTPLLPEADKENCRALKELLLSGVDELVTEAGHPGGTRTLKFESAFEKCIGYFEMLKEEFGFEFEYDDDTEELVFTLSDEVKTAEAAENEARWFRILEIIFQMRESYLRRESFLKRGKDDSFGNRVAWLARRLATLREAALHLQTQLEELGVGPQELSTRMIPNPTNMTVAELLQWTAEVCENGVLLSTRAGKDGMKSLRPDLDQLGKGYTTLYEKRIEIGISELDEEEIHDTFTDIIQAITEAMKSADPSKMQPPTFKGKFDTLYQAANPDGTPKRIKTERRRMFKEALEKITKIDDHQSKMAGFVEKIADQHGKLVDATEANIRPVDPSDNVFFFPTTGVIGSKLHIFLCISNADLNPTLVRDLVGGSWKFRLLPTPITDKHQYIDAESYQPNGTNVVEFDFGKKIKTPGLYMVQIWNDKDVWYQFKQPLVIEDPNAKNPN